MRYDWTRAPFDIPELPPRTGVVRTEDHLWRNALAGYRGISPMPARPVLPRVQYPHPLKRPNRSGCRGHGADALSPTSSGLRPTVGQLPMLVRNSGAPLHSCYALGVSLMPLVREKYSPVRRDYRWAEQPLRLTAPNLARQQ